ncbi:hypothetical protein K490DRAFT_71828 [Saccharata proteae CBS 121410]|uniref:Uncharacterized protein n=1 Tax=Saccharata proteae CBS 121410 TaxID=1314787 RepID=A0A9P4HZ47_9PEZI|nr:hypothetical protein K490DRAFT_71828 [Saccharata proteae CBS 121410]
MPVQHTLFGRPFSFRLNTRYQILLGAFGLVCLVFLLFGTPSTDHVPTVSEIKDTIKNPSLPSIPQAVNPFAPSAHKPPVQANSESGDSKWYSDWKWRNPFSSSITLDENRAVLPPLPPRSPIYTYYDTTIKKGEDVRKAEEDLLLIWRRAWWAQGFKPVVLGPAEAMNHPLYKKVQLMNLDPAIKAEVFRWLAWGTMGTGILSNWLALPMAPHEDAFLSYLRRGEYPKLTSYENSGAFFVGGKVDLDKALKQVLEKPIPKEHATMFDALPKDIYDSKKSDAIALYDRTTVKANYKDVDRSLDESFAKGLRSLAQLINSHLHVTWQNTFESGIAVLKPLPIHMTALVDPAVDIARNLSQCPESPMPATCPPNRKCKPCVASTPMQIQLRPVYRNSSTLYNIGTVPHPYTFTSLNYQRPDLDARFLRREVKIRDLWLQTVTKEHIGTGVSSAARVVAFKEAVASDFGMSHTLWLTAERETHKDLNWIFGFDLPSDPPDDGKSETPVPGPERRPPKPVNERTDGPMPTEEQLAEEVNLLDKARAAIKSTAKEIVRVREVVEAWCLADTEAWRFARAFSARRRMERLKWEDEEKAFAGAEKPRGNGWGRWLDGN